MYIWAICTIHRTPIVIYPCKHEITITIRGSNVTVCTSCLVLICFIQGSSACAYMVKKKSCAKIFCEKTSLFSGAAGSAATPDTVHASSIRPEISSQLPALKLHPPPYKMQCLCGVHPAEYKMHCSVQCLWCSGGDSHLLTCKSGSCKGAVPEHQRNENDDKELNINI